MERDNIFLVGGMLAASAVTYLMSAWIRHKRKEKFVRVGVVTELNCFPVKSCRPVSPRSAILRPLGICTDGVTDRSWMFTRPDGAFLSQRQCPQMALIKVSSHGDLIHLDAPGMSTLKLPKYPNVDKKKVINCRVWNLLLPGMDCGEEASQWACDFLAQKDLHVVFSAPDMKKKDIREENLNPWSELVQPGDESTFSDLTAYLVATSKSLDAVNERLAKPVSMRNFRPNIVVDTMQGAFDEDLWCEVRFGDNTYMRCLHPCPRCLLPTVNPDSGKKDPLLEPYKTLKTFRCKQGCGEDPFFGINGAVDYPGTISVGDAVYARYRTPN